MSRERNSCGPFATRRNWWRTFLQPCASSLLIVIVLVAPSLSAAQVHQKAGGDYIVRANVVDADMLPHEVRAQHGFVDASALLNVVVIEKRIPKPVAAKVTATLENPGGWRRSIELREVIERNRILYVGAFPASAPRSILEITIRAQLPDGSSTVLQFEEWLPDEFR